MSRSADDPVEGFELTWLRQAADDSCVPKFRTALPLACVVLLAGCGAGTNETAPARSVQRGDLGRMIVPKQDLGALARGLPLNGDWSGPSDNKKATEDTIDPRDTARTLARAGRVQGYDRTYAARRHPSAVGALVVSQGVELFRTEKAASVYLNKQLADFKRFRGRTVDGVKLAHVEKFDVDIGDEAGGIRLRVVVPSRGITVFTTIVGFRRGRIVGNAAVQLRRDLLVSGDVERIADGLDDRIADVLSDEVRGLASAPNRKARRTPDPKPLTLEGDDFPLRTRLGHQGYFPGPGVRVYLREYDVLGGSLAGSKVLYLRTMAQVFASPRAAARNQAYLASAKGAKSVARRFLRAGFRETDFRPHNVTAAPIHSHASDTTAFHFFFTTPKGSLEGVLVSVARGRFSASVLVMGYEREVDAGDVLPARGKLRAALRGR